MRMDAGTPKQYLKLGGLPVLCRSLAAVAGSAEIHTVCLVVPEADLGYCRKEVVEPLGIKKEVILAAGGECRQESVYNGLCAIPEKSGIVLVHDGVRPLVSESLVSRCIQAAEKEGACIAAVPAADTVKQVGETGHVENTLDRGRLWMAQTPQAFRLEDIREAHEYARRTGFAGTDDASLIEQMGGSVKVINGSPWNIKITTRQDLELAELVLKCNFLTDM